MNIFIKLFLYPLLIFMIIYFSIFIYVLYVWYDKNKSLKDNIFPTILAPIFIIAYCRGPLCLFDKEKKDQGLLSD
jgi:hypothetical protein